MKPPSTDRIATFLAEKTPRRLLTLGLFVGGLLLFRSLLILLVFFVIFERSFEWMSGLLHQRFKLKRKAALALCFVTFLLLVGGFATIGIGRLIRLSLELRDTLPERIATIQQLPLYEKVREYVDNLDKIVEGALHYAAGVFGYVSTIGHIALYALIGFILAIVFLLDREVLRGFGQKIVQTSMIGTLLRWLGHIADAFFVTVQFQLVVAACNAALTIPVLLLVGVKHVPSLAALIFVSGMVPVVGNFVSGAILSILAYQASGWVGVVLFVVLTFILHKLESFYLNPRLAARHVRLPGFVLIVSLLCWEHVLGFVGLFVSFPFLFVTLRIAHEFRREDQGLPPVDEREPMGVDGNPITATASPSTVGVDSTSPATSSATSQHQ